MKPLNVCMTIEQARVLLQDHCTSWTLHVNCHEIADYSKSCWYTTLSSKSLLTNSSYSQLLNSGPGHSCIFSIRLLSV